MKNFRFHGMMKEIFLLQDEGNHRMKICDTVFHRRRHRNESHTESESERSVRMDS